MVSSAIFRKLKEKGYINLVYLVLQRFLCTLKKEKGFIYVKNKK